MEIEKILPLFMEGFFTTIRSDTAIPPDNFINYFLWLVSIIWRVLSCNILLALSAVFTASISGDSDEETESVAVVFFASLSLLQAVTTAAIVTMVNNFFIMFFDF